MIVQITPVAPGRSHVTTTASVKSDGGSCDTGGGLGNRKAICVCNAQTKLQLNETSGQQQKINLNKKHHGSLDKLLLDKITTTTIPPTSTTTTKVDGPIQTQKTKNIKQNEMQKYYQQVNGDLVEWIGKPRKKSVKEDELFGRPEQQMTFRRSSVKQQKNGQIKTNPDDKIQHFDRTQHQRLSSRSVEGPSTKDEFTGVHQRHSSGPSELTLLKDDSIAEWLLNLTRKSSGDGKKPEQNNKNVKNELCEFFKRPLHRQSSGPSEISVLKSDIVEWLSRQHQSKDRHISRIDSTKPPQPRKRHSLGTNDGNQIKEQIPDWIPYPLQRLSSIPKDKNITVQSSCSDINKKIVEKYDRIAERAKSERKLRHSASEVVTPISDKVPIKPERPTKFHHRLSRESLLPYQQPIQQHRSSTPSGHSSRSTKKEKTRRHQTQRSATVSDMMDAKNVMLPRKSSSAERTAHRSSSLTKCTDPLCPLLPICTDPNCCLNFCNIPRCSSSNCYESRCSSLPRCMDSKCNKLPTDVKSNSLPRSTRSHRSNSHPTSLSRNDSRSSLPRVTKSKQSHHNGKNGKLIKSISAVSLNSRRRRHKTVHFGENLLREVCQNRSKLIKDTPSGSAPLQQNITMLYNFIEGVLSAWVDDDDDNLRSGADSEPERGANLKPFHRCNRARLQTIRRVVTEASALKGSLKLGNSRYRHRHWRGTAKDCNERFLRKV